MKLRLSFICSVFLSFLNCFGGEVPQKVRMELTVVEGYMEKACVPHREVLKPEVGSGYWAAMKRLGDLVIESGQSGWLPSLTPLERRIVALSMGHARHPEMAETLSQWYARSITDVSAETRGIEDKKAYDEWRALRLHQSRVAEVEPVHEEHMTKAYLPAWEAWFLAPGTREKDFMVGSASAILRRNATDELIPVLKYMAQLSVKNDIKRENYEIGIVLNILRGLKTEASVATALEVFALAKQHQIAPYSVCAPRSVEEAADKSAFYDEMFVFYVSGKSSKMPKDVFLDREGKFFLPAIEAALKRKDLDSHDKALLSRTADWIRECCLGGDERKQE